MAASMYFYETRYAIIEEVTNFTINECPKCVNCRKRATNSSIKAVQGNNLL